MTTAYEEETNRLVEARKLRALAEEGRQAGVQVNSAAAELSASSDELAATTLQQSAAA